MPEEMTPSHPISIALLARDRTSLSMSTANSQVLHVSLVEARQHRNSKDLQVAFFLNCGPEDAVISVNGRERDSPAPELANGPAHRFRDIEELEICKDLLSLLFNHPLDEFIVSAGHEELKADLIETDGSRRGDRQASLLRLHRVHRGQR
ncbi:MAG: hypothetical protein MZV70_44380 [Desulfobacterales bacterium]|nr:hypothetical protein [Desulfobacterales bacterium]